MSITRTFTFDNGSSIMQWSVSQFGNRLEITHGNQSEEQKVISQDFDSSQSARLGLDELVAEKLKAGFIETTLASNTLPRQTPRNLPAPERTSAMPTHLCKWRLFETPNDTGPTVFAVAAVFESTFTGKAILAVNYSFLNYWGGIAGGKTQTRFAIPFENMKLAIKAFDGLKDNNDLTSFVSKVETKVFDSNQIEKSALDSDASKKAFVSAFTNIDNSKTQIQSMDYESFTSNDFHEVVNNVHSLLLKQVDSTSNSSEANQNLKIPAIRRVAEMASSDLIVDTWEEARRKDGTIDFSKVSPESSYLLAFARSANHSYGYWVYVKQIIKSLEKSGKHSEVLGALYVSLESNQMTWFSAAGLSDSLHLQKIYGNDSPSLQTYRYMQRRARRYLSDIQKTDIDRYSKLMLSTLSFIPANINGRSFDANKHWIFAELLYGNAWIDGNHGRKVYLPEAKVLANDVHISNHIETKLVSHQEWVTKLFEWSKCSDVVSFAYQLLDRANLDVPIDMNRERLTFLMENSNIKLCADVQSFLEQDFNRLVELFGDSSYSYVKYCAQPNARVVELVKLLISKKGNRSIVTDVISSLVDYDLDALTAVLEELRTDPGWTNLYLSTEIRIKLLAANFDRTIEIYGEDVVTDTGNPYVFYAWINALQATQVESLSTKDIYSVLNVIGEQFGKLFLIDGGIYNQGKASMHSAIRAISKESHFGNLARVLVAYSSQLRNPRDQRNVGAVLASLMKSEADFVWLVKWADEFAAQNILLSLPELEFSVIPWHSALKARIRKYLDSATIVEAASTRNVSLGGLIDLAVAFGSQDFFENLTVSPRNRTLAVGSLRSELIRSESEIVESLLQACKTELTIAASKDLQLIFDLTSSQSLSNQQLGLDAISELGLQEKTWIRLMESQSPLSMNFVENYISSLAGSNFDDAVILCLDSSVQSVREVGLSLLQDQAERINIDSLYVKLAETTDPHLAVLVAARALQPGIPDETAVDIFDSRLLKTVRQGRKAKNLVKERRINSVHSGTPVSPEFQEMVDDIARYGNEQDRDWAIEFNSFKGFVETSESALKLLEGDA
jgi:hypothetical protein